MARSYRESFFSKMKWHLGVFVTTFFQSAFTMHRVCIQVAKSFADYSKSRSNESTFMALILYHLLINTDLEECVIFTCIDF